jgi:hypothetical protein
MTYSYIKKIEPQNKFGTKRGPQNNKERKKARKIRFGGQQKHVTHPTLIDKKSASIMTISD